MFTCRVQGCRFPQSHVAFAHRCGKCNRFGHGEMECGNQRKINYLKTISINDKLDNNYCDLQDCNYRWSHQSSAHHCNKCGERAHSITNCPKRIPTHPTIFDRWEDDSNYLSGNTSINTNQPSKKYIIECPKCRTSNESDSIKKVYADAECCICREKDAEVLLETCRHVCICEDCCNKLNKNKDTSISSSSGTQSSSSISDFPDDDEGSEERARHIMGNNEGKIYVSILAGQGCSFRYRRDNNNGPLERLFMHSDDWGQYGHGRVAEHGSFISGYRMV